ncbi:MAG: signal peptide peptidase SppA [Nitrospinaceae bacterium]|nr:signal peptide peptidase SppA [Nitrospinaceae bacterium]
MKVIIFRVFLFFWVVIFSYSCALIKVSPQIESFEEIVVEEGSAVEKILLIDIDGPISNRPKKTLVGFRSDTGMVDRIREILKKAEKDKNIKGILLRVNSPGGTVTSSDIIYHEIKSFKERFKVKVYVSVIDVAASGGYYVALAGDRIMVHPTSLVGSIGVLALKLNLESLMDKVGVEWEVVKSSQKKDFMSPFRPLTKEERVLFQETIDRYYDRFVDLVVLNRDGLDVKEVRALADGRVYNARQALNNHLVDSIGYLKDLVELAKKELDQPDLKVVTYSRPREYKSNYYSSMGSTPKINLINLDLGFDWNQISPQFLFLWGQ